MGRVLDGGAGPEDENESAVLRFIPRDFADAGHARAERPASHVEMQYVSDLDVRLLLNVLPQSIADRLKRGETMIADHFDTATVLFADLVGFTPLSRTMEPQSAAGGWMPRPRKDSAAIVRKTKQNRKPNSASSGERMFGKISRVMIHSSRSP